VSDHETQPGSVVPHGRAAEVFAAFLKLGVTSFGGPIAHLGYFRDEFVTRRSWLDEASYADIVALCQFLRLARIHRTVRHRHDPVRLRGRRIR
jgi:chromate transporter